MLRFFRLGRVPGLLKMQQTSIGLVLMALSLLLLSDKALPGEDEFMKAVKQMLIVPVGYQQCAGRKPYGAETKCRRKAVPPTTISKVSLKKSARMQKQGKNYISIPRKGRAIESNRPVSPFELPAHLAMEKDDWALQSGFARIFNLRQIAHSAFKNPNIIDKMTYDANVCVISCYHDLGFQEKV